MARDGIAPWVSGTLPTNLKWSAGPRDEDTREAMKAKLNTVHHKKYVDKGHIRNLTHVFPVDKADGNIHLVYDCSCSLVNEALFAPSFALPTIEAVLWAMESDTWGGGGGGGGATSTSVRCFSTSHCMICFRHSVG